MSDSVWKKEISFKRKPKGVEPELEVVAEKTSFLRKELSLSRAPKEKKEKKQKAAKPAGESLLKKEISFSRKPKAPKQPQPLAIEEPQEPKPAKQPFLKKEISFSRKKRETEIDRLMHEATQSLSASFVPSEPASLETLPTARAEAAVAAMAQAEEQAQAQARAQALADAQAAAQAQAEAEARAVAEAEAAALAHADDVARAQAESDARRAAEHEAAAAAFDASVQAAFVEHPPAEAEPVAAETVAQAPVVVEPEAAEPEHPVAVEPEHPVAGEPVAVEPAAWSAPEPEPEPWLAEPVLPPASEASGVVVHPPVAAADLPPLELPATGPFWKKELSFSRTPKAAKAPKPPKAVKAAKASKPASASAPFWKKDLSFGRKAAAEPVEETAVLPDAPTEALPAAEKGGPFWKKQMAFSKPSLSFSLPRRPSGGGKGGGHAVKKLVGLKIGSSQLAAARVSNNGVAEVQQLVREALAPGIVVGGELRDPEALGDALKSFFARNKLPRKGVRIGIASNRIGVRIFDIVGVTEEKQLANAIHFRAQEALPIPLDEAVLDFRVLDESIDDEGQVVKRVLLVVVYRELVERYVSACRKAGIQLAGIDLEAFALLRSLAAPADRGSSALVGVSIGYDRSTFAVSDGRVCEFTRVLEWGGSALNVALARTFDSTPSEVEAIKRSLSLDESTTPPGLTPEQMTLALDAVRRQVQSFARELVSSLQFYQNQPGSLGIGEIVLTGGTAHMPGLAAELERLIGVHVRVGDPFGRVKISKRLEATEQSGSLAVAIGLGIED